MATRELKCPNTRNDFQTTGQAMSKKSLSHHIGHAFSALRYSMAGIRHTALHETAFMQELLGFVIIPLAGWLMGFPAGSVMLMVAGWLAVMAVELLNSAIEAVCNLVSPDFHPLVKVAKDAGSAAVLMMLLANAVYWAYLIWVYLL